MLLAWMKFLKLAQHQQTAADADAINFILSILIGMTKLSLLIAVLGGFWLYYFNRSAIRQLFDERAKRNELMLSETYVG